VSLVAGEAGEGARAVLVLQADDVDFPELERAARAILAGAPLLTGSYVAAYAGAEGPVFSRGAMLTAALAKVTGARPRVVGKPSRASVREVSERLGAPAESLVVVGDDVALDVALGRLAGAHTILVRSGISGADDLGRLPASRRPHETIDGVADLLPRLSGGLTPLHKGV
jgi:NagD protein